MSNKSVYLAYRTDSPEKSWHVVGLLSYIEETRSFLFQYTRGALKNSKFPPFHGMLDLYKKYLLAELPPLFQNRILYAKRPEFAQLMDWLGLQKDANPIDILALSGGHRITDSLHTFGKVEIDENNRFQHSFFIHGLAYSTPSTCNHLSHLKKGDKLYCCLDKQNDIDHNAVLIRTESPYFMLGYVPRYLAKPVAQLLSTKPNSFELRVQAINELAPLHYRLQCHMVGEIPPESELTP